ncbi:MULTISPECIES: hypothetical protein [unclassified Tatumella]|uniref:hypothetical protein n=1 Tax=unclassified Tatumella TaxID=2649542 RepID=UPI001BB0D31A|nr:MULTISPECIES: hypothetical protein [unclassified Tatumella]MBS0854962.1 hypothetical protein [Tatumella sp. JGM16]MBS0912076.1 hypothetical protein [Tatumella sp. JGM91]
MKFIIWLISLFNREKEKMTEPVASATVAEQPAVADTVQPATTEPASTDTGIVENVERDLGQFYDIVKELTERFGAEYKELAIDFAKAVSVKK